MGPTAERAWAAAIDTPDAARAPGDVALAQLLRAHFLIVGHGTADAARLLGPEAWSRALAAYEFYGLAEVAAQLASTQPLDARESRAAYRRLVPDIERLRAAFLAHFAANPGEYAARPAPARPTAPQGRERIGTAAFVLVALTVLSVATAQAVSWYRERTRKVALSELRAQIDPRALPIVAEFERDHGVCPWRLEGPPRPLGDVGGQPAWLDVKRLEFTPRAQGWPGRGVVLSCEGVRPAIDRSQVQLPAAQRAQSVAEVTWVAFLTRRVLPNAYSYGLTPVDVERAELELRDVESGERLAHGSAEAVPPPSQPQAAARARYDLDDRTIARLIQQTLALESSATR